MFMEWLLMIDLDLLGTLKLPKDLTAEFLNDDPTTELVVFKNSAGHIVMEMPYEIYQQLLNWKLE
jgi:hypothetical protein